MPVEQLNLTQRPEGCHAKLIDDGRQQQIPVCLGGVSIIGCNNAAECRELFGKRIGKRSSVPVLFVEDNIVERIVTVPRGSLLSDELKTGLDQPK